VRDSNRDQLVETCGCHEGWHGRARCWDNSAEGVDRTGVSEKRPQGSSSRTESTAARNTVYEHGTRSEDGSWSLQAGRALTTGAASGDRIARSGTCWPSRRWRRLAARSARGFARDRGAAVPAVDLCDEQSVCGEELEAEYHTVGRRWRAQGAQQSARCRTREAECGKRGEPVGWRSISSLQVGGVCDVVLCDRAEWSGQPHGGRRALWGSTADPCGKQEQSW